MIYSDGAGAVVLSESDRGRRDSKSPFCNLCFDEAHFIYFGESYNQRAE